MSALYLFALVAFALVQLMLRFRVNRLEKRYVRVATEAHALLDKSGKRPGNSNHADPLTAACVQYELAQLGLRRDRAEGRYLRAQAFRERFAGLRARLSGYKGKALPYALGAIDAAAVAVALDRYGVEQVKLLLGLAA